MAGGSGNPGGTEMSEKSDQVANSALVLLQDHDLPRPKELWGCRHTLALMGFLGNALVYAMRVNVFITIVAMVKQNNTADSPNNSFVPDSDGCPVPDDYVENDSGNNKGEFDWDDGTQGVILGSFFYGYAVTNFIGGRMAEYLGVKIVFGIGVLLNSIFTLLSPVCVRVSTTLFIIIRILVGMTAGIAFPAMNFMLASWVPQNERAKFTTWVYAGVQLGTVATMASSGWLCDSDFMGGWPSVFYIVGALGVVWTIPWFLLAFNDPQLHPRITKEEQEYILHYCGKKREKALPLPWNAVLTSLPIWAIIVVHFGNNWGFYTLLTELPTYLDKIQHFNLKSNGVLSSVPYLIMWIFSVVFGGIADRLLDAGKISNLAIRKISMSIGVFGPMLGLIAMCFVNCDGALAMGVLCVAVGLNGAVYSGFMSSHQDLSPNLASSLLGLSNTVATIPGFVSPVVTGSITDGNETLSAWRTVFLISVGTYLVSNIFYLVFISTDIQPWNEQNPKTVPGQNYELPSVLLDHEMEEGDTKERY